MKNRIQKANKNESQLVNLESQLDSLLKGQEKNSDKLQIIGEELRRGFIGLALRNEELLKSNEQLKQQLNKVQKELNAIKEEQEAKAVRKKARANRKRLPKRDPMTAEIYKELIKESEGPTYLNVRLRLVLCLLTVTGVRINELLNIKVYELKTLTQESWIAIDRSKRGPSNHKAFLTKEGKKLIQDRKKDFQFIFLMKEPNSYLFTAESNHYKPLDRVVITRDVNKVMREVSKQLPVKLNITSHSFRIGYITQLWKDSKDIEFVKQTIGHQKLDTTSAYVNKLSDQERQKRIDQLK
nr:hypothetical protein [Cylindrotheca closterium]